MGTLALIITVLVAAASLYGALASREASRLNLTIDGGCMAKIGDSFVARIAPTNVAGQPAPVFNAVYIEEGDSYTVSPAPDGLSAVLTAVSSGAGNLVRVDAFSKGGVLLSEFRALADVESPPDAEEAVALNLSIQPA